MKLIFFMILAVYKPKGPSSYKIISQIKRITNMKKVGHAGTLDPLASGVLVVAIGRESTKKLKDIVGSEKEYLAEIELGATSKTDDGEGPISRNSVSKKITEQEAAIALKKFVGEIEQTPPIFSAIKVNGQRAYKNARKGKEVLLKPRKVLIKEIKLVNYQWPILKIKVITGPGVYIRALARDIGQALGTGAYMKELERTRVGEFTKETAIKDLSQIHYEHQ